MKKILVTIIVLIILGGAYYLITPLFIDNVVEEDLDAVFITDDDNIESPESEELEVETSEEHFDTSVVEPEIIISAEGSFQDVDNFHKGSGQAKLLSSSGDSVLRLENFDVTNGPDLYVVLSENSDPINNGLGDYINLGRLKGNIGNQNYEISTDTDISKYKSAVIYCQAFSVIFSVATFN